MRTTDHISNVAAVRTAISEVTATTTAAPTATAAPVTVAPVGGPP